MSICYNCFKNKETTGACPACGYDPAGAAEEYPMALHPGSILNGRYIVGRVLGQGGFGITYIAIDDHTGKRVAIKEYLPTEFAGRRKGSSTVRIYSFENAENFEFGKERFLEEAKTLAEFIGDEHIVRVFSYFEENGTAYFTMEYVEGMPLDKYMATKGGRLSTEEANELLLPLMDALDLVHSKGIVHRDIAPDNIIITPEGKAKLIDFGAARYSTGEKSKSLDVVIKHGFAPKEQYTRHGRQGPFTDVYAMGATYYYAITGRVPPDSIDRTEEDDLVLPSALGVKIRAGEEEVLEKALEVSSSERYRSMGEFRTAMAAAGENNQQKQEEAAEEARREKEQEEREKAERQRREKENGEAAEKQQQEKERREAAEQSQREREAAQQNKTVTETSEKKKRPSWLIPALAGAAALIVLLGIFAGKGGNKTDSGIETAVTGEKTTEANNASVNEENSVSPDADNDDFKISVGDVITFGRFEQDNNESNGPEEIEWIVLKKEKGRLLVISKYALAASAFNTSYVECTWENSTLREWLNGSFYNSAFNSNEQGIIQTVTVDADKNPTSDIDPGRSTEDQVFLLSITEAEEYFSSNEDRRCEPTAYAVSQGSEVDNDNTIDGRNTCWWWLRSPGYAPSWAAHVFGDGLVDHVGMTVNWKNEAVRPAVWIDSDEYALIGSALHNGSESLKYIQVQKQIGMA